MRKWMGWVASVLIFCVVFMGILHSSNEKTVSAVDDNPFYVTGNDFEVTEVWNNDDNYKITLRYIGENEDGLPQYGTAGYSLSNFFLQTDDDDLMKVKKLSPPANNDTYSVSLWFAMETKESVKGYADVAPTKLVIPTGTQIGLSSLYTTYVGEYTSLIFTSALTLEKYTTDANEECWRCIPVETYERYDVDISKEDTVLSVYRNTENCICTQIRVPYTAKTNAKYEGIAPIKIEGIAHSPSVEITQEKGSDILLITLKNSQNVIGSMGNVTFNVTEGTIVDEVSKIIYELEGIQTYYGYADGTFTQEKKIEIRVQDGDHYTVITVNDYIASYRIPQIKGKTGHIFYKWIIDGEEYPENAALRLEAYKETGVDVFAEYIACGLINGAWLRVDDSFTSSGIRFQSVITKEAFEKYKEHICGMGIIVMPTDLIEEGKDFTLQNYADEPKALNFYVSKNDINCTDGAFSLKATLNDIQQIDYNRSYSARAYLVMNFGGTNVYFWENNILQRTPYDLANAVLENLASSLTAAQIITVQKYAQSVLNIKSVGENAILVDKTGAQDASLIAHSTVDGTLTLAIKTSINKFPCITYNGKRIKESTQTYVDGTLTIVFKIEKTA